MTAGRRQHAQETDEALVSVRDNPRASRFELRVNGVSAGYVTYRDARSGRAFEHTVMATEYQRMGPASQLIAFALDEAGAASRNVLPFCPFVRSFIQRHAAYLDLVGQPERFGLMVHTPDSA